MSWQPPEPTVAIQTIDHQIDHAERLCERGEFEEAEKLLRRLRGDPKQQRRIAWIMGRIESTYADIKSKEQHRRQWRYRLRMHTQWNRFVAYCVSIFLIGYGGWNLKNAVAIGLRSGWSAPVRSPQIFRDRNMSGLDWVWPVSTDVIYSLGLITLGVSVFLVVKWVSLGAADWEELIDSDSDGLRR